MEVAPEDKGDPPPLKIVPLRVSNRAIFIQ